MATVSPVVSSTQVQGVDVHKVSWTGVVTGDTLVGFGIPDRSAVAGAVQISGTFGGATVKLQASNDGTNYFDMKDITATALSAAAASLFEFTSSALYLRPSITSGSANSVNIILVLRG